MKRSLAYWVMFAALAAAPAYAQTTATGTGGAGGSSDVSSSVSSGNQNTNLNGSTNLNYSRSGVSNSGNSRATGAIGGSQINAPVSTSSRASVGYVGSSARTGSSTSSVTINSGSGDPSGDPSGSNGSGDPTINYSGGYTVHNVPEVIAPNIVGGNPCAVGVSGGVAVAGFGLTGGGTWADRACERRQEAALLYNIGQHEASIALLCQDDHVREAMTAVGQACGTRVALRSLPSLPAAQATFVRPMAAAPSAVPVSAVAAPAMPPRPDWCDTVSGPVERARYRAQCLWFPAAAVLAQPHHRAGRVARNDR